MFLTYFSREIFLKKFKFSDTEKYKDICTSFHVFRKLYPIIMEKYIYFCIRIQYVTTIITGTESCFPAHYRLLKNILFTKSIYNEQHYIMRKSSFYNIRKISRWTFCFLKRRIIQHLMYTWCTKISFLSFYGSKERSFKIKKYIKC